MNRDAPIGGKAAPTSDTPVRGEVAPTASPPALRLYDELADWWPLMSPPGDYAEEAAFFARTLTGACAGPPRSLLELGSGGGHVASHMKTRFELTLVEPAAGMRRVSAELNPECEHVEGDMRTLRLGRTFDAVLVHDAVCYMTREADLEAAMRTAHLHCRPGGAALFAPDHVRENFFAGVDDGGADGDGRGMRWLEWTFDPDPNDSSYVVEYAFMLREAGRPVRVVHDTHVEGLFARSDWLRLLARVGFEPEVRPFDHSELEPGGHEIFVARRPSG